MLRIAPWLLLATAFALPANAQHDFDPSGRRRRPPATGGGGGGARQPRRPEPKKPSVDELIDRYTKALLSQPHSAFPLQKLTELYRQRDGNLDGLVSDFEKRAKAAAGTPGEVDLKLALAGVYLRAQRKEDATRLLDDVIRERPQLASPRLMRATLAEQEGDKAAARQHYEAALPLLRQANERERVTRQLMLLSLDLKDFEAAKKHHDALVRAAGGSIFVKKELGIELMNRNEYGRAEDELRKVVAGAAGDNRALAPALRDLGLALAKQKKLDEALATLTRARNIAGSQAGIRNEILAILTEVYREQGKLTELIIILEKEPGRDFARLATIGALYEETGQVDKAIAAYRSALALDRRNVDVRIKLVHLLQTAGLLDEAIAEYKSLIKAAPDNAELVFELAETYIQRGERDQALALVADLERRSSGNGDVLAAVADFYERIEEPARAVKVFERLAGLPQSDPQHIIDLGDRYFQQGDKQRALATWRRLLTAVGNRAQALAMLGEVYLEHDMPDEALEALREALELAAGTPQHGRYLKQLASALERTGSAAGSAHYRFREALQIWERLLRRAGDDPLLARECRNHIVGLWAILRELDDKVAPLEEKLAAEPPDLESGRLLAEVQRRLNRLGDAEKTLRKIVSLEPGDEQSLLALERVLVMQRNINGAIEVLEKLVALNPRRAREYYQRMAQYAAELYRDDDAIEYASKALALSPQDAEGHYRLALMYRRRQQTEKAMTELRTAISKNHRLYKAYFDLAELLLSRAKVDEADRLYRQVVRSARDEEYVMRATRLSMQINLGRGTLDSLERELLPVALGNPQKPVYRRLLVEIYGAMTFPLVHAARLGQGPEADKARSELAAIGARAVKPLLDALGDSGASQQRVAIEVLAYVQNKGAGPALFNFALGHADTDLRVRAMIACGALEDPALLDRYEELLAPPAGGIGAGANDAVTMAAAWSVARMGNRKAEPLLGKLLGSAAPEVRALAALGLGLTGNREHGEALSRLARAPDAGAYARAAAAYALGELGSRAHRPLLLALTESSEGEVRTAALLALARLELAGAKRGAVAIPGDLAAVLARAMLSEREGLRRTAVAAATALTTGEYRRSGSALPVPEGAVTLSAVLEGMTPMGYQPAERAQAIAALEQPLARAAAAAVATSAERAQVVAELVLGRLSSLVGTSAADDRLAGVSEAIASATVKGFVALSRHPSLEVRKRALELLSRRDEPEAQAAVRHALDASDPDLCNAALASIEGLTEPETAAIIVKLLSQASDWSLRSHAASALGRAGALDEATARTVDEALARAARGDSFALVREAALRALAARNPDAARPVLSDAAGADDEPRIRTVAAELVEAL